MTPSLSLLLYILSWLCVRYNTCCAPCYCTTTRWGSATQDNSYNKWQSCYRLLQQFIRQSCLYSMWWTWSLATRESRDPGHEQRSIIKNTITCTARSPFNIVHVSEVCACAIPLQLNQLACVTWTKEKERKTERGTLRRERPGNKILLFHEQ